MRTVPRPTALLVTAVLAGCTDPWPTAPFGTAVPPTRVESALDTGSAGSDHVFVVAFSGGGTRAAALSQGALAALGSTRLESGGTMLDEIDILSSTSGGSVTAANFALRGPGSFADFERQFLRYRFMGRLKRSLLNPVGFVSNVLIENDRIEPLVEVFEERVFADATVGDALARPGAPYLILNTTEASGGLTFPITQLYFDLICSDVRPYPLARAVAASAAYPVALSAVTLRNRCTEDGTSPERARELVKQNRPEPGDAPVLAPGDPAARGWAYRAQQLMDGEVDYLHLFDGGISDNLGLGEPLRLLTKTFDGNPISTAVLDDLGRVSILSVDARSLGVESYDRSEQPPNMLEAIFAVVGGAIGSRMSGLATQGALFASEVTSINLGRCAREAYAEDGDHYRRFGQCMLPGGETRVTRLDGEYMPISFNNIVEPSCRANFGAIGTNWALEDDTVTALLLLGKGLTLANRNYGEVAAASDALESSTSLRARGVELVRAACRCIRGDCPDA